MAVPAPNLNKRTCSPAMRCGSASVRNSANSFLHQVQSSRAASFFSLTLFFFPVAAQRSPTFHPEPDPTTQILERRIGAHTPPISRASERPPVFLCPSRLGSSLVLRRFQLGLSLSHIHRQPLDDRKPCRPPRQGWAERSVHVMLPHIGVGCWWSPDLVPASGDFPSASGREDPRAPSDGGGTPLVPSRLFPGRAVSTFILFLPLLDTFLGYSLVFSSRYTPLFSYCFVSHTITFWHVCLF